MFWKTIGIVALVAQMPFLITAFLIGPPMPKWLTWNKALVVIDVFRVVRWAFIPASLASLIAMLADGVPYWFAGLGALLDAFLLGWYWHAGRDAVVEHGDREAELRTERRMAVEQFYADQVQP